MAEIALAGLLFCVAAGTGMTVLRLFKLNYSRWECLALGTALGLGLFSYLILGLGMIGWLYSGAVWALIGILFPLAAWGFLSYLKLDRFRFSVLGNWERLGVGILVWCAFFNIFVALAPPFLADSLKYHLAAPKWYISLHQIQFVPVFPFNMPQNMEMIYTAGMLLHCDTVGLLVHYSLGILAALGILLLAREFSSLSTAIWTAVLFYVGIPSIPHAAHGADLGPIFYSVW
ncbi:MAG: hypothetical protein GQ544_04220, partial [Candidatus Aminicenantes bacterium]|nr:hypothetical protein [Candidatus Aminicenantes bacterium]